MKIYQFQLQLTFNALQLQLKCLTTVEYTVLQKLVNFKKKVYQ